MNGKLLNPRVNSTCTDPAIKFGSWDYRCEERLRTAYNRFGPNRFMYALGNVMREAGLLNEDANETK